MLLLLVLPPNFQTPREPHGLDSECREPYHLAPGTGSLVVGGVGAVVVLGPAAIYTAAAKFQPYGPDNAALCSKSSLQSSPVPLIQLAGLDELGTTTLGMTLLKSVNGSQYIPNINDTYGAEYSKGELEIIHP